MRTHGQIRNTVAGYHLALVNGVQGSWLPEITFESFFLPKPHMRRRPTWCEVSAGGCLLPTPRCVFTGTVRENHEEGKSVRQTSRSHSDLRTFCRHEPADGIQRPFCPRVMWLSRQKAWQVQGRPVAEKRGKTRVLSTWARSTVGSRCQELLAYGAGSHLGVFQWLLEESTWRAGSTYRES